MQKWVGLALVALGLLALVYRGFTYTGERHNVSMGPVKIHVDERERVNVPHGVGVAAVAGGALLLAFGSRNKR
jgi:drug/metabolite transporter (DMT)-like permease